MLLKMTSRQVSYRPELAKSANRLWVNAGLDLQILSLGKINAVAENKFADLTLMVTLALKDASRGRG